MYAPLLISRAYGLWAHHCRRARHHQWLGDATSRTAAAASTAATADLCQRRITARL